MAHGYSQRRAPVRPVFHYALPLALFAAGVVFAALARSSSTAEAIAPCVAHSNTAEEGELLQMVESWRAQNIAGASTLTLSAPLNAAAMGYAQYVADTPGASGHFADGSDWSGRALQCGFTSNGSQAAGGEGFSRATTAAGALAEMATHTGSGIYVPDGGSIPVQCAGVAKATGSQGTVWIVMLMKRVGSCPQPVSVESSTPTPTSTSTSTTPGGQGSPTSTSTSILPTATKTSTPTASATATATATAIPTRPGSQLPHKIFSIFVTSQP